MYTSDHHSHDMSSHSSIKLRVSQLRSFLCIPLVLVFMCISIAVLVRINSYCVSSANMYF